MPARLSVEELEPARAVRRRRARVRRGFPGARVERALRLAPRDAAGIFDLAIEGLLARFGPCFGVALLLWIPFRGVAELLGVTGGDGLAVAVLALGWNLLELVPRAMSESVTVSLVVDALEDRRTPPQASIRRGLARAPGVAILLAITQIALLPLLVLLVVPFFLAQWLTWSAVPIHVLEGDALLTPAERARARRDPLFWCVAAVRRIARALARSVRLSLGAPALGRWLLLVLVAQLVLAGLSQLGVLAATDPAAREALREHVGIGSAAAELLLGAFAAALTAVTVCVQAALRAAYYLDLRVRREGWDLELSLREGAEPAEAR